MRNVRPLLSARSMDDLVVLPRGTAVRSFFDALNCRVLFRLLAVFSLAELGGALVMLGTGRFAELATSVGMLAVIRLLYAGRDHPAFERHFRPILLGYLSAQLAQLRSLTGGASLTPIEIVLPFTLLFFRLRWQHLLVPLGALWAASAGNHLMVSLIGGQPLEPWAIGAPTAVSLAVLALGHTLTQAAQLEFIDKWRTAQRRYHEQRRMREELGDARRIQLSMLPDGDPRLPWLDVAGISIPASEVGGDYYGYFRISDSRLVVVVADVAGHGMASGLLLSGIRSCLHLLHLEEPEEPAIILDKLDRMVQTTSRQFFVTLLYTLFDQDRRTIAVAAAGHPPLLRYRAADGEVEEVDLPSLPLGTSLRDRRRQRLLTFDPGDILLLYTDGIAETLNAGGAVYGYQRLHHRLRATDHGQSAQEIRNTLLGDIVAFKGDCEQTDDITLVVIKAC